MRTHVCRWLAVFILICPALSFSQAGRTELLGVVRDASGLPVPNATITAHHQATMARYPATSDDRGEYHLLGLPPGQYGVTVEQPGFAVGPQRGLTLRLAARVVP